MKQTSNNIHNIYKHTQKKTIPLHLYLNHVFQFKDFLKSKSLNG